MWQIKTKLPRKPYGSKSTGKDSQNAFGPRVLRKCQRLHYGLLPSSGNIGIGKQTLTVFVAPS